IQGAEYNGTAEDGVVCAGTTCAGTDSVCCVTFAGAALAGACIGPSDPCTALIAVQLPCDGTEDCEAGQECCIDGESFSTSCVAEGTCHQDGPTDATGCINTDECGADEMCCGFAGDMDLPVDLGTCAPAANNCSTSG
ncbi:MAG: hypothetical protein IT382_21730, partial [Deltaproteobacteria bacterium]|nr:hypothetical protein [Deltaproteobacteria bacterium]